MVRILQEELGHYGISIPEVGTAAKESISILTVIATADQVKGQIPPA
jgi:hypothetical protein